MRRKTLNIGKECSTTFVFGHPNPPPTFMKETQIKAAMFSSSQIISLRHTITAMIGVAQHNIIFALLKKLLAL